MQEKITLGVAGMTLEDLVQIARKNTGVELAEESKRRIVSARRLVNQWVQEGKIIYGITTGFGALSGITISGKGHAQTPGQYPQKSCGGRWEGFG